MFTYSFIKIGWGGTMRVNMSTTVNSASGDLYKILDIPSTASFDEIKTSFLKKAKETHPDKENGSAEMFQIVNNAYEVLSDPQQRAEYNRKSGIAVSRRGASGREHIYRNQGYGARGNFHQAQTDRNNKYNIKYGNRGYETDYDISGIHIVQNRNKNKEQTAHQRHFETKLKQQPLQRPQNIKTKTGHGVGLVAMFVGTMLTIATIKFASKSKHRR